MIGKKMYKIWAPKSKWSAWVRPVTFVNIDNITKFKYINTSLEDILYVKENIKDMAIVVDLPGAESVKEGVSLAKLGYVPVAVFNGVNAQNNAESTVDIEPIIEALVLGAEIIMDLSFTSDASPAFLLDSNRINSFKSNSTVYDNSWDIYSQDMPTAEYLLNNGINKILLVSDKIRHDINKILHSYKNAGIEILYTDGTNEGVSIKLPKAKKDIE